MTAAPDQVCLAQTAAPCPAPGHGRDPGLRCGPARSTAPAAWLVRRLPAWLAMLGLMGGLANAQAQGNAAPAPAPAPATAPTAAPAGPAFDVLEFQIEGNTVLPVIEIEQAVTPFLGPGGGMAQVEAARAALERVYQQSGYLTVFVDIPEQAVQDGTVRLQVLQGRVDRLRVVGSRYFSQGFIRDTVAELAEGNTPNFNTVQRQLAALNRNDERSVQPVLRPGRLPGTVEVDLQVKDRLPLEASAELHNRHAAGTSETRLSATARYNNLWQRGHGLGLTLTTAPQQTQEAQTLLLNYSLPLADDASLAAYLVLSNSLTEPLTAVSVAGKGLSLGLRYLQPLPALDRFSHSLSAGLDFKDFKTRVATGDSGVLTPLRYLPFTLGYNAQWSGGEADATHSSSLSSEIVAAQRRLLARQVNCADSGPADQFACSATGTDGSFAYWRGELRHNRAAPGGGRWALRLGWQFAPAPLVGNERYALGGAESVRGYFEAQASGDLGVLASVEWRSANGGGAQGWAGFSALDELVAYGFADAGQTQVLNALGGQPVLTQLRGVGLGLQWRLGKSLNGTLDLAWPLLTLGATAANDPRLHLRLAYAL